MTQVIATINITIGTKAQLIKMAPVIRRLHESGHPFSFVWTGQHAETIDLLLEAFKLPEPTYLLEYHSEANTKKKLWKWAAACWKSLHLERDLFNEKKIVVVHGDTLSTLIVALAARKFGAHVAHIEAGLRSQTFFDPFPEEIIRRITSRIASYHYCPDSWSKRNLRTLAQDLSIVDTGGNTLLDSLRDALTTKSILPTTQAKPFGIFSMHRFENIGATRKFFGLIERICEISKIIDIRFIMHPATRHRLEVTGLLSRVQETPGIIVTPRMDYPDFIYLVRQARFLITDGGSNQEEASYLGIPCLLLRKNTERQEGLTDNVVLSRLEPTIISDFVTKSANSTWQLKPIPHHSPSAIIVADLIERAKAI